MTRGDDDGNIRVTKIQRNHLKFRSNNVDSRFIREKRAEEEARRGDEFRDRVAVRDPETVEYKKSTIRKYITGMLQKKTKLMKEGNVNVLASEQSWKEVCLFLTFLQVLQTSSKWFVGRNYLDLLRILGLFLTEWRCTKRVILLLIKLIVITWKNVPPSDMAAPIHDRFKAPNGLYHRPGHGSWSISHRLVVYLGVTLEVVFYGTEAWLKT
ncbi:hypothetical protein OPV22_024512 [Ensete ventricosum]|uniref:Uncharacterized protein n=1 Tax=Ensete ventricosum TaxID=4639 RepID=A0AAV8QA79_ENSVE|nr:hypothetical protein OPV22_024512 [Ensete ventricosum]